MAIRKNLTGTKFISGRGNVRSTENTKGVIYNNGPRMVKGTWVAVGNNRYRWTGTNPPVGAYALDCQDGDNSFQADCSNWSDTAENQYGETSADGSMTSGLTGGHNIHTVCPDCPGKGMMIPVFAYGGPAGGSNYDPYSSGNGTRGGGMNNPITQTNLMARRNEFVYESTGQPYVGLYHVHQDGTRMIGPGQMGMTHEIYSDEVIVPARRRRMR